MVDCRSLSAAGTSSSASDCACCSGKTETFSLTWAASTDVEAGTGCDTSLIDSIRFGTLDCSRSISTGASLTKTSSARVALPDPAPFGPVDMDGTADEALPVLDLRSSFNSNPFGICFQTFLPCVSHALRCSSSLASTSERVGEILSRRGLTSGDAWGERDEWDPPRDGPALDAP